MTTRLPNVHPSDTSKWPHSLGQFDIGSADPGSKILMYNETPLNLQLDFLNGSTDTLHAWEANWWPLDGETRQVNWQIDADSLNVSSPPISAVFLTLYGAQEILHGQYPMALVRQASVGNVGGISTTNVAQVINDGNPLQQVVEATLSGHSSSDVIINNDGSVTFKGAAALGLVGVLTHILGDLTDDGKLTVKGTSSLDNGNITSDGNGNITAGIHNRQTAGTIITSGGTSRGVLACDLTNTHLNAPTGQVFVDANGVNAALFDTTLGVQSQGSQGFTFSSGGFLPNLSFFSGTGSGTYNHGFGSAPFWVCPISTTLNGSATQGYDTVTSTQVHVTLGAANTFKAACM